MDNNFNQPNYGENNGFTDNTSSTSAGHSDSEYSIRYQPGTNVYRAYEPQHTQPRQYQQSYTSPYPAGTAYQSQDSAERGNGTLKGLFIGIGVCALLAVAIFLGVKLGETVTGSADKPSSQESVSLEVSQSPVTSVEIIPSDGERLTYAQIAAKFRRAVVSVTVYYDAYGWASYVYSEGSGFIIDEQGYIVTNSHVIDDDDNGKYKITVTIVGPNGEMNEVEAKVIGNDARTDLAVLKVDPKGLDLVVSELGQSSALVLGDEVVAIGNPGGAQFAGSITNGIISGIDRVIDSDAGTSDSAMKYLQTNAAISPGNSGGPLLNMYGQVIGINTAKIVDEGYESLGFAIPLDTALPIIREIIEVGSVVRPALGISCKVLSKQSAQWYDVPEGLLIAGFYSNSTLPAAGVQIGDIIVSCDGVETLTLNDLQNAIETKQVGEKVELTVFRSGREGTLTFSAALIADNDTGELMQNTPGRP